MDANAQRQLLSDLLELFPEKWSDEDFISGVRSGGSVFAGDLPDYDARAMHRVYETVAECSQRPGVPAWVIEKLCDIVISGVMLQNMNNGLPAINTVQRIDAVLRRHGAYDTTGGLQ